MEGDHGEPQVAVDWGSLLSTKEDAHRRHWPRRRHHRSTTALPHGDYHDRTGRPHDHAQGAPLRLTRRATPAGGQRDNGGATDCVQEPGNMSVKRKHRRPGVGRPNGYFWSRGGYLRFD